MTTYDVYGSNHLMSYPGNLTKSNSDDLQPSPVSTPELHSNKSLCQESEITKIDNLYIILYFIIVVLQTLQLQVQQTPCSP